MAKKRGFVIPLLLFIVVSLVGFALSPSIGPAWDEPDNMFAGGVYYNYVARGFNPVVFDTWTADSSYVQAQIAPLDRNISHLPPIHNYVGIALIRGAELMGIAATPTTIITIYHVVASLFFALVVLYTFRFALMIGLTTIESVIAASFTYLYPMLFGFGYGETKDIAQASMLIVSLYHLSRFTIKHTRRDFIVGAVFFGLGLATKFNAVYIPIIWILYDLGFKIYELRIKKTIKLFLHLKSYILLLAVGFTTAIVVWPYLWYDTIEHAKNVVQYFTSVGNGYKFLWNGEVFESGKGIAYWWYPLGSFLIQTPIPILILFAIGLFSVILSVRSRPWNRLLLLWIVIPLLRIFLPYSSLYDQLRHYVEIIPAVMIIAVMGLRQIAGRTKPVMHILSIGIVLYLAVINIRYAPYASGYYNELASNPNVNFDRDIRAFAVKEGVDYLHKTYGHIILWSPLGGHLSWYYLTSGDQYVYTPDYADSIILINKSSHFKASEFEQAIQNTFRKDYTIARGDAIFGWVYRRK